MSITKLEVPHLLESLVNQVWGGGKGRMACLLEKVLAALLALHSIPGTWYYHWKGKGSR